jgi:hypothetical protein
MKTIGEIKELYKSMKVYSMLEDDSVISKVTFNTFRNTIANIYGREFELLETSWNCEAIKMLEGDQQK